MRSRWLSSTNAPATCPDCGSGSFGADGDCDGCGQRRPAAARHTELDLDVIAAVTVGWFGDSRAYWLPDDGEPACLTGNDSIGAQLTAAGVETSAVALLPFPPPLAPGGTLP